MENEKEPCLSASSGACAPDAAPVVLLVEDDPAMMRLTSRMLKPHYRIVRAADLESATIAMEEHDVQVMVCDHMLPDGLGLDFLAALRTRRAAPVGILITGYSEETLAIKAANSGAVFRYLKKPFPASALLQTVQDALRHHQRRREQDAAVRHHGRWAARVPALARTGVFVHYTVMILIAIGVLFVGALLLGLLVLMTLYILKSGLGIDLFQDVHLKDIVP